MTSIGTRKPASPAQVRELERILQRQPGSRFFASLAEAYVAEGRQAEALSLAEKGVALHPDFARGRIALALALDALGREDEARAALAPLGEGGGVAGDAWTTLAQARLARGDRAAARLFAEMALAAVPSNRDAQAVLASAGGDGAGGPAAGHEGPTGGDRGLAGAIAARERGETPSPDDPPLLADTSTFPPWAAVPAGVVASAAKFKAAPSYGETGQVQIPRLGAALAPRGPGERPLRLQGPGASAPGAASRAAHGAEAAPTAAATVTAGPSAAERRADAFDDVTVPGVGSLDFEDVELVPDPPEPAARPLQRSAAAGAAGAAPERVRAVTAPPLAPVAQGRMAPSAAMRPAGAGVAAPASAPAASSDGVVVSTQPGSAAERTTFVRDMPAPGERPARSRTGLVVGAVVVGAVLAGGAFALWRFRAQIDTLLLGGSTDPEEDGSGPDDGPLARPDPGTASAGPSTASPEKPASAAPDGPVDRAAIGALLAGGRPAAAVARLDGAGVEDATVRGLALAAAGRAAEALPHLEAARKAYPADGEIALALVEAYLSAGDEAKATAAAGALPASVKELGAGLVALHAGDTKRALRSLKKGAASAEGAARGPAGALYARALLGADRVGAAADAIAVARKAAPDDVEVAATEALVRARAGETEAARKTARALAERKPAIESPGALCTIADALAEAGDAKGALEAATRATEAAPADARAQLALGRAALASGDAARARTAFEAAVKSAPGDPLALAGLASSLVALGDPTAAAVPAAKAYEAAPELPEAALARAAVLIAKGEAAAAGKILKPLAKAMKGKGRMEARVQLLLGKSHAARGKKGVKKAVEAYERALAVRDSAEGHWLLGQALELRAGKKKAPAAALDEYRAALALDEAYANAHLSLGLALAKAKKPPAEARKSLERYLALVAEGPGVASASEALARLPK